MNLRLFSEMPKRGQRGGRLRRNLWGYCSVGEVTKQGVKSHQVSLRQ